MKIKIKSWLTGGVLFAVEAGDLKAALLIAVKEKADLTRADLTGADLTGADLTGADLKGARLETGETIGEYIEQVVPALITAGGKTIAEVAAAAWNCHAWENCPMHVAFDGAMSADDPKVPLLLRPRVLQFVSLFDAGVLPNPLGEKATASCEVKP